jgi:thiamine biosynthesis lipoprotein
MSENETPTPEAPPAAEGARELAPRKELAPVFPALVGGLAVVAAIVVVMLILGGAGGKLDRYEHRPKLLLSPDCQILLVMRDDQKEPARGALYQAEAALRDVESRVTELQEGSEIALLNSAKAGQRVPLSPPIMEALRAARELHAASHGAFDVTIRPLLRLWEQAAKEGRLPSADEIAAARKASAWDQIELFEGGVVKRTDTAGVDLGGMAKGLAADRATETLQALGAKGGVVRLGGVLRCFGRREDGEAWPVDVLDPFAKDGKALMALAVGDAATCTYTPYYRYYVIGGRSYGHVLDPGTGWPVSGVAAATVVAPSAAQAESWATALCVLGDGGLKLLPAGVEAMLVVGTPQSHKVHVSDSFQRFRVLVNKSK